MMAKPSPSKVARAALTGTVPPTAFGEASPVLSGSATACIQVLPTPAPTGDQVAMLLNDALTPSARNRRLTQPAENEGNNRGVVWAVLAFAGLALAYASTVRRHHPS